MLKADEPISRIEDDLLRRGHLVEIIGNSILAIDSPDPIVMALNAPWGAGKTSFLNLLENYIGDVEKDEPAIVVRFNPWHYTNIDQLVSMFLEEIALAIETKKPGETAKEIKKLLQGVGTLIGSIPSGTGIGAVAGSALGIVSNLIGREGTLGDLKTFLGNKLEDLGGRLVIFIDDIDRLERDAMRMLFRLIRLNADFANTTYVLAFDRNVVEKNLDEENGVKGRDYLEKIVQVGFDIPVPEPSKVYEALFQELNQILGSVETPNFDRTRWGNLFQFGLKDHFRTIRHVRRYTNSLRLTLLPVVYDVDLVDFFGIEMLRVFHPEIYLECWRNRNMLATDPPGLWNSISREDRIKWVEQLCETYAKDNSSSLIGVFKQLFPQLKENYVESFYPDWRKKQRVCSPEIFSKYFLLSPPVGEVSGFETQVFLKALNSKESTIAVLVDALEKGIARSLLRRIQDHTNELSVAHAKSLVEAMLELGDELRFEDQGMFDTGGQWAVPRIIYQCLGRFSTEAERKNILLDNLPTGKALFTLIQEVSLAEPKEDQKDTRLFWDYEEWCDLKNAAVKRIREEHDSGFIWQNSELPYILYRWREWKMKAPFRRL